jgi:hypothetical protein
LTANRSRRFLVLAISAMTACLLELNTLARHVQRLPDDRFGILLYSAVVLALAAAAIWAAIGWVRSRH